MEMTQENVEKLIESLEYKDSELNKDMKKSQIMIEDLAAKYMKEHSEIEDFAELKRGFEDYLRENKIVKDDPEIESNLNESKETSEDDERED